MAFNWQATNNFEFNTANNNNSFNWSSNCSNRMTLDQEISAQFNIKCICGSNMIIIQNNLAYNDGGTPSCDCCRNMINQYMYHCPMKKNNIHQNGYDYCLKCASNQFKTQTINEFKLNTKNIYEQRIKSIDFTSLENRYQKRYGYGGHDTKDILSEYKKFLIIKCVNEDYDASKYSPSPIVDTMWHLHILDTKKYLEAMNILFDGNKKFFIHHDIDGDLDTNARDKRYINTINQYKLLFGEKCDSKHWPQQESNARLSWFWSMEKIMKDTEQSSNC